jgi:serine/threonine protein kinase
VKILDFGVATLVPPSENAVEHSTAATTVTGTDVLTAADQTLGTVAYMSPEQARAETLDARAKLPDDLFPRVPVFGQRLGIDCAEVEAACLRLAVMTGQAIGIDDCAQGDVHCVQGDVYR